MKLNNNILINIPHSSLYIPKLFIENLLIDEEYIKNELDLLTDLYVDKLFYDKRSYTIKANFSRLFCDVERFRNDKYEIMSKIGMGAIYIKTTKGDDLIKYDEEYKKFVLENYYDIYHSNLNKITEKIIEKYGKCIIIDAHSFSEELLKRTNVKYNILPDICIGFEEDFYDENIVNIFKQNFEKNSFTVDFNNPYKGSIVPNNYYHSKDHRVKSIMIEINKNVYLDENNMKNKNYNKVKNIISNSIIEIEKIKIK